MKITAATAIAQKLGAAGCKHAFGMPGGEVLTVMQALDQAGIEFTLVKHENAAGYMAEGTYHATGVPGVMLTTIGPGLVNGLNSVANAFQEQVPLIVLSGCIDRAEAEGFTHQVIDQDALMAPITKARFRVAEGTASKVIDKAIALAMSDPMGPVHIDVPHNLASDEVFATPIPPISDRAVWPEGESLAKAREMLANAKRPVILAGMGAMQHDAGSAILRLAEKFQAPIVTTYKAKGVVDESHPLCLGSHGLSPRSDTVVLPLLASSDCVILAGYDPIEMRNGWIDPWLPEVAIDISHVDVQHGMHGAAVRFIGDVGGSLDQLASATKGDTWQNDDVQTARATLKTMFENRDEWGPHQVFATARKSLPDSTIATVDSGAHRILLSQMWDCPAPRTMLQSSAFCTMGISLPLAIGYAKADTGVPVVSFLGDAGLEMVIGELATLRALKLPVIIIVTVDNSLSLIELKQSRSNLPNLGVDFEGSDLVNIAKAYGGNAAWIDDAETLEAEISNALEADNFTVLACRIDKSHYRESF